MYKTWIDEWASRPRLCRKPAATTKGTPTMAYLNGILMPALQLGRHEAIALETGMQSEHEARGFCPRGIRRPGRDGQNADAG